MKAIAILASLAILIIGIVLQLSAHQCDEKRLTSNGVYSVNLVQCVDSNDQPNSYLELSDNKGESIELVKFKGNEQPFQFEFSWTEKQALTISYTDDNNQLNIEQPSVNVLRKHISIKLIKRDTQNNRLQRSAS